MAVRCYKATVTLVDHLWYCATFQVNLLLAPLWRTMGLDAVRAHDSWPADIDSIRCLQFRQFSSVYSCLRVLSIWYAYIRSASCAARWCPLIFASWCGAVHVHILKKKKKGLYWLRKILHNTENTTLLYYRRDAEACCCGQYSARRWCGWGQNVATDLVQFNTVQMFLVTLLESCCTRWCTYEALNVVEYGPVETGFNFFHMLCRQLMTTMSSNRVRVGTVDWWLFTPSFARAGEKTGYCASSCSSTTYKLASGNYWLLTWF